MLDIIGLIGLGYPIADDACPIYVSVHTHEYRPYAKVSREASNTLLYLIIGSPSLYVSYLCL